MMLPVMFVFTFCIKWDVLRTVVLVSKSLTNGQVLEKDVVPHSLLFCPYVQKSVHATL